MPDNTGKSSDLWRGVDLSGITLVLGPGAGRLTELLALEAQAAGGLVIVAGYADAALRQAMPETPDLPVEYISCRYRALPLADASIDLCVVNGSLREVPAPHYHTLLEEIWRVLVPGGALRVSDLLAPSSDPSGRAWAARAETIRALGKALGRPVALDADVAALARCMQEAGYEGMAVSLLPGFELTDDWLTDTVDALRLMASRVGDPQLRRQLLEGNLGQLVAAYRSGGQKAADRFVMRGNKVGNLALDMETAGTEDLLAARDTEPPTSAADEQAGAQS